MSRLSILRISAQIFLMSAALTAVFGTGIGAGIYFYPLLNIDHVEDEHRHDDHASEDDADHEDHHLALTKEAFANLSLKLGKVRRDDYWKTILVPARIVEIPGRSDLTVSAPVAGIVEEVRVLAGESIFANQSLFELRLTDESIIDKQSQLLASNKREEVVRQEIDRLTPLIKSGAVPGTKKRDLTYELEQIEAEQRTLNQELISRGLPESLVAQLVERRELISRITIRSPAYVESTNNSDSNAPSGYSIEQLAVHPGKAVLRGDELCNVAYHSKLYIEGTAFEEDLEVLERIADEDWTIFAELHASEHDHSAETVLEDLHLLRVDNHVDKETQTVRFFIEIPNHVSRRQKKDQRLFELWRFRPGQRMHLRLPVEKWDKQIVLPNSAVVMDGPNVIVFVKHIEPHAHNHSHAHAHSHPEDEDHEEEDYIEFEPVPVRMLNRDDRFTVIADDGQFDAKTRIAVNSAQKLYLALKMQQTGGGGHHHDHDH